MIALVRDELVRTGADVEIMEVGSVLPKAPADKPLALRMVDQILKSIFGNTNIGISCYPNCPKRQPKCADKDTLDAAKGMNCHTVAGLSFSAMKMTSAEYNVVSDRYQFCSLDDRFRSPLFEVVEPGKEIILFFRTHTASPKSFLIIPGWQRPGKRRFADRERRPIAPAECGIEKLGERAAARPDVSGAIHVAVARYML